MQLQQQIPAIWVYTSGERYNQPRGDYANFLTPAQKMRLERIRQARLLYEGKHREYFIREERTQFDFPRVRKTGGREHILFIQFNVLKLMSEKIGGLMFGEMPTFAVPETFTAQRQALSDLVDRSGLQSLLREAAVAASYEAECFLEACIYRGDVYIQIVPADEIFPIGQLKPDGQYASYDRYRITNIGTDQAPIMLLLQTTYLPGQITNALYQLSSEGTKTKIDLAAWPVVPGESPLADVVETGLADNTIVWIPNKLHAGNAVSSYDGLIELADELNAKQTQIARVLAQHADPAMAFPEEMFDEQGNIRADYKAFSYREKDKLPTYIVWQAQLDAAITDRNFTLRGLLILAEMSPALLGLKEGAAPETINKLRLEATNTLDMVSGKAILWAPRIKKILTIAQALEQTIPGTRYDAAPIGVSIRDGLPIDLNDLANYQATLAAADRQSLENAVEERIPDPASAAKEIARIRANQAANAPMVFGGDGGQQSTHVEKGPAGDAEGANADGLQEAA